MHLNKSVLASALILAFSSPSFAQGYVWEDIPSSDYSDTLLVNEDNVGNLVVKSAGNKQHNYALYVNGAEQENKNTGKIWAIGHIESSNNGYAYGMFANNSSVAINEGSIFVNSEKVSGYTAPRDVAKGMAVSNGGTATNNALIYVKSGAGMYDQREGAASTMHNADDGVIVADGNQSYGIVYGGLKDTKVTNSGTITAKNKGTAVYITNEFDNFDKENGNGKFFVNTSNIIADSTSTAIYVASTAKAVTVNLSGASHIEGKVTLQKDTNLVIEELDNAETISLNRYAGNISVTDSDVTFTQASDSTLEIASVETKGNGNVTFSFDKLGSADDPNLKIGSVGESNVAYNYSSKVSDEVYADQSKVQDLFNGILIGEDTHPDSVHTDQGAWAAETIYNADGSKQVLGENNLLSSATDLAITNALMWRSQLSNLTDRMGTLRTMPETAGAWARYNDGRLDGRGIQHDYNTVEVGFDKAISNNIMLGISFDYTKGDTDLDAGTSDNNTYTLGLYGSYFNESGCFLDAMLKVGRIDTDYDLNNGISEKGDYMLTGTIVGIETGHRWNIQNYFIEPQVQLTYSYLRPENYNTNLREVKFDDMKSLIARVGIMGGMKFAEDRGSAYVKASYNHDFLGDIEGNYSGVTAAGNAVRVNVDDELDDNWGEVSLGASYQVTDSVNTFVDVGTGFGGDIDQKWRVNLGARYVF